MAILVRNRRLSKEETRAYHCLGNAVVPAVVNAIAHSLLEAGVFQ